MSVAGNGSFAPHNKGDLRMKKNETISINKMVDFKELFWTRFRGKKIKRIVEKKIRQHNKRNLKILFAEIA